MIKERTLVEGSMFLQTSIPHIFFISSHAVQTNYHATFVISDVYFDVGMLDRAKVLCFPKGTLRHLQKVKRHSQPSPLFCLFTWSNLTYDYTGTDREPSLYVTEQVIKSAFQIK